MLESEGESTNLHLLLLAGGADPGLRGALTHGALHALHLLLHLAGWPGGGQTCQQEEERDQRIWQNSASTFQSIAAHHPSLQTYLVTFLQSFSSLMLHVGRNSVSQTTFSTWTTDVKKMQLSQQKMKSHLRLLDFFLNRDHFQPTARRKGLRRYIVKPNIIYL